MSGPGLPRRRETQPKFVYASGPLDHAGSSPPCTEATDPNEAAKPPTNRRPHQRSNSCRSRRQSSVRIRRQPSCLQGHPDSDEARRADRELITHTGDVQASRPRRSIEAQQPPGMRRVRCRRSRNKHQPAACETTGHSRSCMSGRSSARTTRWRGVASALDRPVGFINHARGVFLWPRRRC